MSEHVWHEDFVTTGPWENLKATCLQGWRCKVCKTVSHTPLNSHPSKHVQTDCVPPPPQVKQPWKSPIKEKRSANKTKDYPAKKKTDEVKGARYD
jgi:hypothetical protein